MEYFGLKLLHHAFSKTLLKRVLASLDIQKGKMVAAQLQLVSVMKPLHIGIIASVPSHDSHYRFKFGCRRPGLSKDRAAAQESNTFNA